MTIDEIITLVNIALGSANAGACAAALPSGATVDIALIIQAVNHALIGCVIQGPVYAGPIVGYFCILRDPDGNLVEFCHGQPVNQKNLE